MYFPPCKLIREVNIFSILFRIRLVTVLSFFFSSHTLDLTFHWCIYGALLLDEVPYNLVPHKK